jgi:hypothetical protein
MRTTFEEVFSDFGGPASLARATGLSPVHAQTMKTRDSIPPAYWPQIVLAARQRGIDWITAETLAEIAAAKRGLVPAEGATS